MTVPQKSKGAGASMQEAMRALAPYMGLGLQLALSMAFFAVGGFLLDRWLGTQPCLLLLGVGLGLMAIFAKLWQVGVRSRKPPKPP
jgi:ATP synthase protein I